MTRILLAFLALLGFAVQAAPVEAAQNCSVGSAEVGAPAFVRRLAGTAAAPPARFVTAFPGAKLPNQSDVEAPAIAAPRIPAVLIGIDRARR